MWISGCIDKFIYIVVKERFEREIHVKYSQFETVFDVEVIKHPIIREALKRFNVKSRIEVICLADLPGRTGLGSSGAFTVGLLNALHHYFFPDAINSPDPTSLAEEAFTIEHDVLKRPVGKQDPYCASYGGVRAYTVTQDGWVATFELPSSTVLRLEDCLLMVYTGLRRGSVTLLRETQENPRYFELTEQVYELGRRKLQALITRDMETYGRLLHEYWSLKKRFAPDITNPTIDTLYSFGLKHGALGGKVMGAGGGGFLLFVCPSREDRDRLKQKFRERDVEVVDFKFWHRGSEVIQI